MQWSRYFICLPLRDAIRFSNSWSGIKPGHVNFSTCGAFACPIAWKMSACRFSGSSIAWNSPCDLAGFCMSRSASGTMLSTVSILSSPPTFISSCASWTKCSLMFWWTYLNLFSSMVSKKCKYLALWSISISSRVSSLQGRYSIRFSL